MIARGFTEQERAAGFRIEAAAVSAITHLERCRVVGGLRMHGHRHERPHIMLVLSGSMTELGTRSAEMGPGTLRITGPATHDIHFGPDGLDCLVVEADPAWLPAAACVEVRSRVCPDPAIARMAARLTAYLDATPADLPLLDLDTIELFSQHARRPRRGAPPSWLLRVRDLLAESVTTPSLATVSREAGVHPNHLVRAFRDHFGVGSADFVRRTRVARAARAIAGSVEPLSRIAITTGYCDQSHMSREVRSLLGLTPTQLRTSNDEASARGGRRTPRT